MDFVKNVRRRGEGDMNAKVLAEVVEKRFTYVTKVFAGLVIGSIVITEIYYTIENGDYTSVFGILMGLVGTILTLGLTPFGWVIIIFFLARSKLRNYQKTHRVCPHCDKSISSRAIVCPHCLRVRGVSA